jgi:pyruvate,orthophosphate dikinase
MIEVPRGALTADEIAQSAEFFSFGTNDLTQTDVRHLARRLGQVPAAVPGEEDPRRRPVRDDRHRPASASWSRSRREGPRDAPDLKLGICGEHGGDPASIHFFEKVGLDYVSCSPYRVPVARLAAAQAALYFGTNKGA